VYKGINFLQIALVRLDFGGKPTESQGFLAERFPLTRHPLSAQKQSCQFSVISFQQTSGRQFENSQSDPESKIHVPCRGHQMMGLVRKAESGKRKASVVLT
jgi:hypothetical protein